MIPVDQSDFDHAHGDCLTACVASILELPLYAVPRFIDAPDSYAALQTWLGCYGLTAVYTPVDQPEVHVLIGRSPRGAHNHAVVGYGRQVIHDPHPHRTGLADVRETLAIRRVS